MLTYTCIAVQGFCALMQKSTAPDLISNTFPQIGEHSLAISKPPNLPCQCCHYLKTMSFEEVIECLHDEEEEGGKENSCYQLLGGCINFRQELSHPKTPEEKKDMSGSSPMVRFICLETHLWWHCIISMGLPEWFTPKLSPSFCNNSQSISLEQVF